MVRRILALSLLVIQGCGPTDTAPAELSAYPEQSRGKCMDEMDECNRQCYLQDYLEQDNVDRCTIRCLSANIKCDDTTKNQER